MKARKAGSRLSFLLLAAALLGCAGEDAGESAAPPPGSIARVGDRFLTEEELGHLLPDGGRTPLSPGEKARLVREWVELEVFYAEAVSRGLDDDPRVRARIERLEKEFLADHLVFLQLREDISVSEEEIEEYFEDNEREYRYEYRVSHILVNTFEEAENVLEMLGTRSFSWVADRYSVDPVARRGGDLGYLTKGNMIPEFESVVFDLAPGGISDIIRSDFGYHIIKLIGTREAQVKVSLDDVRERILNGLLMEKRQKAYERFHDEILSSADIEYYEGGIGDEPGESAGGDTLETIPREENGEG